jgi:hypothetical protein
VSGASIAPEHTASSSRGRRWRRMTCAGITPLLALIGVAAASISPQEAAAHPERSSI